MDFNNPKAVQIYTKKTGLFDAEKLILKEYLQYPCRILDLGCGVGRTTRVLKDLGHSVIGIDIAPQMVEQAITLHPDIMFLEGDATNLVFPDDSFDFVLFSFNGLDCIYPEIERVQAMKEAHRILKRGGGFIFSSHDKTALQNSRRNWRRRPRHFKGFYYKEKTVYGDLLMYYGYTSRNLNTLRAIGFKEPKYYENFGKGWRYYVAWK